LRTVARVTRKHAQTKLDDVIGTLKGKFEEEVNNIHDDTEDLRCLLVRKDVEISQLQKTVTD
jgi:hypothetical protein